MAEEDKQIEALMWASFEAEIPERLRRASSVRLQNIIPAHWFSAAASECAGMYIAGFFYGAISMTQAYVEALSKYLAEHHKIRVGKDVAERCRRLRDCDVLSAPGFDAATKILNDRNDFHHLGKYLFGCFFAIYINAIAYGVEVLNRRMREACIFR